MTLKKRLGRLEARAPVEAPRLLSPTDRLRRFFVLYRAALQQAGQEWPAWVEGMAEHAARDPGYAETLLAQFRELILPALRARRRELQRQAGRQGGKP